MNFQTGISLCLGALIALFGLQGSASILLNAHKPLYIVLSLSALAFACFALWLIWRVLKRPIAAVPNPAPLLMFPAIASDAIPQMIHVVQRGGTLGLPSLLEAVGLIVGLLGLCFHPSGFRSLRKSAA